MKRPTPAYELALQGAEYLLLGTFTNQQHKTFRMHDLTTGSIDLSPYIWYCYGTVL